MTQLDKALIRLRIRIPEKRRCPLCSAAHPDGRGGIARLVNGLCSRHYQRQRRYGDAAHKPANNTAWSY